MSIENHPNINAAGLTSDVISAVLSRRRGNARLKSEQGGEVLECLRDRITDFCVKVSEDLDAKFGS